MAGDTVGQVVARLARPGPLDGEHLAARLGVTLQPSEENPDWTFYTFELPDGPFANGVLRLSTEGDAALISLSPRDPPGLTEAEVDRAAWGPRRDATPKPRLSPEGADALTYQLGDVTLTTLWTHTSRRLLNLALEWPAPSGPAELPTQP
jgi:hypothetical protein